MKQVNGQYEINNRPSCLRANIIDNSSSLSNFVDSIKYDYGYEITLSLRMMEYGYFVIFLPVYPTVNTVTANRTKITLDTLFKLTNCATFNIITQRTSYGCAFI